ncbi:phosphoenolpyruvate carboxykinase (ATP) [Pseudomonas aeruginosa]
MWTLVLRPVRHRQRPEPLTADESRYLIGDDEHGWGGGRGVQRRRRLLVPSGIDLSERLSRCHLESHRVRRRAGNVVLDELSVQSNYADDSLTQNSRAAYPLGARREAFRRRNLGGEPNAVIFLTCDLAGRTAAGIDPEQ